MEIVMIRAMIFLAIGFAIGLVPMWLPLFGFDLIAWLQSYFSFTPSHAERTAYRLSGVSALIFFGIILVRSKDSWKDW